MRITHNVYSRKCTCTGTSRLHLNETLIVGRAVQGQRLSANCMSYGGAIVFFSILLGVGTRVWEVAHIREAIMYGTSSHMLKMPAYKKCAHIFMKSLAT